jgi:hypothetical protein
MKILSLLFLTIFWATVCDSIKAQDIETTMMNTQQHKRFYQKNNGKKSDADGFKDRDGNDKPVPTKNFGCRLERISGLFKRWMVYQINQPKNVL